MTLMIKKAEYQYSLEEWLHWRKPHFLNICYPVDPWNSQNKAWGGEGRWDAQYRAWKKAWNDLKVRQNFPFQI